MHKNSNNLNSQASIENLQDYKTKTIIQFFFPYFNKKYIENMSDIGEHYLFDYKWNKYISPKSRVFDKNIKNNFWMDLSKIILPHYPEVIISEISKVNIFDGIIVFQYRNIEHMCQISHISALYEATQFAKVREELAHKKKWAKSINKQTSKIKTKLTLIISKK